MHNTDFEKLPVVLEKVRIHGATIIPEIGSVKFLISIFEGSGYFEICEGGNIKVSGKIRLPEKIEKERAQLPHFAEKTFDEEFTLNTSDIYKDFILRGYEYKGNFKSILSSNYQFTVGEVKWMNNWVTYLDSLLQFLINTTHTLLHVITGLEKMSIDPALHKRIVETIPDGKGITVNRYANVNIIKSGGVEIKGVNNLSVQRRQHNQAQPKLEKSIFVPYENNQSLDSDPEKAKLNALEVLLQIVSENMEIRRIKAVELAENRPAETLLSPIISDVLLCDAMLHVSSP